MLRILTIILCCLITNAYASTFDAIKVSVGKGRPNQLKGGRAALMWDWQQPLIEKSNWQLTGYWEANIAHWRVDGNCKDCKQLTTLGFAPVFRLQSHTLSPNFTPYLEGSVGLAALSDNRLGHRHLGAHWSFQDLMGAGVRFGDQQRFDLSYHYLHYSNANLVKPNNGVDVKILLSLAYHFG